MVGRIDYIRFEIAVLEGPQDATSVVVYPFTQASIGGHGVLALIL